MWITTSGICDNVDKEMSIQRENSRKITKNLKNNTLPGLHIAHSIYFIDRAD
jgi:effector-binding domain-containing protein